MIYTVELLPSAAKYLGSLPVADQRRIQKKLDDLESEPHPRGSRKLQGNKKDENLWRVRAGDYRIIYSVDGNALVVLVVRIRNRKDAYKKK